MNSLRFECDENKNISNQKKHGVSFEDAETVFSDELGRLIHDPDHSEGEERFIVPIRQFKTMHFQCKALAIKIASQSDTLFNNITTFSRF